MVAILVFQDIDSRKLSCSATLQCPQYSSISTGVPKLSAAGIVPASVCRPGVVLGVAGMLIGRRKECHRDGAGQYRGIPAFTNGSSMQ